MKKKIIKIVPFVLIILIVLPCIVYAGGGTLSGLEAAAKAAGLKDGKVSDWKDIFAIIINAVLMTIGFLSVCISIYGGFLWMTAAGDDAKVAQAKKIIAAGVIGVVIILLSMAITSTVFGLMGVKLATWSG